MPSIEKSIEFEVWYPLLTTFRNGEVTLTVSLTMIQTVYSSFNIRLENH